MSTLYLVGVPIGCWEDITFRALEILKKTDVIAAEDTRKAKKLLSNFAIHPQKLIAHHTANEQSSSGGIVSLLKEGNSVAFISDAGMPGISDPGFLLARTAMEEGAEVKVIPGVSAAPTAVVVSGLPCDRFFFQGFLPRSGGKQMKRLQTLNSYGETLVFYESPRRIVETLENMVAVLGGDREACLCRELTKTHEEILRLPLEELLTNLQQRDEVLGEITLVVAGQVAAQELSEEDTISFIQKAIADGVSPKLLKKDLAEKLGISASEAYKIILQHNT